MSIERILPNKKNDIANFCDWEMKLPLAFEKFNLIYGYNGAGKTTLSNLLKDKDNNIETREACDVFVFNKNYVNENISSKAIKPVDIEKIQENRNEIDFGKNIQTNKEIDKINDKNREIQDAKKRFKHSISYSKSNGYRYCS